MRDRSLFEIQGLKLNWMSVFLFQLMTCIEKMKDRESEKQGSDNSNSNSERCGK
jgi:hypothetical protein